MKRRTRVDLYPYRLFSKAAKEVQSEFVERGLPCWRIRESGNFFPRTNKLVLNWGNPREPAWDEDMLRVPIVNQPSAVARASDKLKCFELLQEASVSIPEFTTDSDDVKTDIEQIGERTKEVNDTRWLARKYLNASSGRGIVSIRPQDNRIPDAPLYCRYIKKLNEYRVHVFDGQVIDIQQKKVRAGSEGNNFEVRNAANGWVFCRDGSPTVAWRTCAMTQRLLSSCSAMNLTQGLL